MIRLKHNFLQVYHQKWSSENSNTLNLRKKNNYQETNLNPEMLLMLTDTRKKNFSRKF